MITWQERIFQSLGFKDAYMEWRKWADWRLDRWRDGNCQFIDFGPVHLAYLA